VGDEPAGLERLSHRRGGKVEALQKEAVGVAQVGTVVGPGPWNGETGHRGGHEVGLARDVPAAGRDGAARGLDEGPHHQIGAHRGPNGFLLLHKLAVTVVHENLAPGRPLLADQADQPPDLR